MERKQVHTNQHVFSLAPAFFFEEIINNKPKQAEEN